MAINCRVSLLKYASTSAVYHTGTAGAFYLSARSGMSTVDRIGDVISSEAEFFVPLRSNGPSALYKRRSKTLPGDDSMSAGANKH